MKPTTEINTLIEETAAEPPSPAAPITAVVCEHCEHCGCDSVRPSSTRRGADLLPAHLGKIPYRCRMCRRRFYVTADMAALETGSNDNRRRPSRKRDPIWKRPGVKRHLSEAVIASASLVAFGVFLYLLARSGFAAF